MLGRPVAGSVNAQRGTNMTVEQPAPSAQLFTPAGFATALREFLVDPAAVASRTPAMPSRRPRSDGRPSVEEAWVTGMYHCILRRDPDPVGLKTHIELLAAGMPPADMISSLSANPEAARTSGEVPEAHEVFVTGAFLTVLGREPDEGGSAAGINFLAGGGDPAELLRSIADSAEASAELRVLPEEAQTHHTVAKLLQRTLFEVEDESVTEELALRHAAGESLLGLVQSRAQRGNGRVARWKFRLRGPAMAHRVETAVAAELLRDEVITSRRWQWRVDRRTWDQLDRIEHSIHVILARLDAMEAERLRSRDGS